MKAIGLYVSLLAFLLTGSPLVVESHAGQPEHAGGGKPEKKIKHHESKSENGRRMERSVRRSHSVDRRTHFAEEQKVVVRAYYDERVRAGKCPPGLAKKNNGCMPPGHAKKWVMGRPLPTDVVYYPLPAVLVTRLPPAPAQHRYVRVAADILLIAWGTGMVVDAIQDLGRI